MSNESARPGKGGLLETIGRIRRLKNAAMGVSTGPTGLSPEQVHVKQHIDAYGAKVDLAREDLYGPSEETIRQSFKGTVSDLISKGRFKPDDWRHTPWEPQRLIEMDRFAGTVISFSDDHQNPIAEEFFPIEEMLQFLQEVQTRYKDSGKKLNVIDQFEIALSLSNQNPVGAGLLIHSSFRSVARVLDTRVSKRLKFPVTSAAEEISMTGIAECTAHYRENSSNADPLGDSYHWWGQFAAGMVFELHRTGSPIQSSMYRNAFYFGPDLMKFARETLMGKTMIAGNHKEVDRQGLRLGKEMGELIRNAPR